MSLWNPVRECRQACLQGSRQELSTQKTMLAVGETEVQGSGVCQIRLLSVVQGTRQCVKTHSTTCPGSYGSGYLYTVSTLRRANWTRSSCGKMWQDSWREWSMCLEPC